MNTATLRRATGLFIVIGIVFTLVFIAKTATFVLAQGDSATSDKGTVLPTGILQQSSDDQTIILPADMLPKDGWFVIYTANPISPTLGPNNYAMPSIITWQKLDEDFWASAIEDGAARIKLPPPGKRACWLTTIANDVLGDPFAGPMWLTLMVFSQSRPDLALLPANTLEITSTVALQPLCEIKESPFSLDGQIEFSTGVMSITLDYLPLPPPTPTPTATDTPTPAPTTQTPTPTSTPMDTPTPPATIDFVAIIRDAQATASDSELTPSVVETLAALLQEKEATRQAALDNQIALLKDAIQDVSNQINVALAATPTSTHTATPIVTLTTAAEATRVQEIINGVIAGLPTPRIILTERRLVVPDQSNNGNFVTATYLASDEATWLAVYDATDTGFTKPLGRSYVEPGVYDFNQVALVEAPATNFLSAVLLADRGTPGIFEPGIDQPLSRFPGGTEPVEAVFSLTLPNDTLPSAPSTSTFTPTPSLSPTPIGPPLDRLRISFTTVDNKRGCGGKNDINQPEVVWHDEVIHIAYPAEVNIEDYLAAYMFELVAIPDGVNVQFGAERPPSAIGLLEADQNVALLRDHFKEIRSPKVYTGRLAKETIYQLAIVAHEVNGATHLQTDGGCYFKLDTSLY